MKQPKYEVGQKLTDTRGDSFSFTIMYVSPKADFEGQYTYFIEVLRDNGDIWYELEEEWVLDESYEVTQ